MKQLALDKPVLEMVMFELAHNSCSIRDGKAWYRDYDLNVDARVLIPVIGQKIQNREQIGGSC